MKTLIEVENIPCKDLYSLIHQESLSYETLSKINEKFCEVNKTFSGFYIIKDQNQENIIKIPEREIYKFQTNIQEKQAKIILPEKDKLLLRPTEFFTIDLGERMLYFGVKIKFNDENDFYALYKNHKNYKIIKL